MVWTSGNYQTYEICLTEYNVQIDISRKSFLQYITKDVNSIKNFLFIIEITLLFIGIVFFIF
jgi:hypothetical protein